MRIESGVDEESHAPWCRVTWDIGESVIGLGTDLPEAVIEALQEVRLKGAPGGPGRLHRAGGSSAVSPGSIGASARALGS